MDEELRKRIRRKVKAYYGKKDTGTMPTEAEKKAFLDSLKESLRKGELSGPLEESDTDIDPFR